MNVQVRVLDLDGSIVEQTSFLRQSEPSVVKLQDWGPRVRLACRHSSFKQFQTQLAERIGSPTDDPGLVNFLGSGDFHHVSLALLRRQRHPFHLLVLDNHPDWMRGIPFLHCGTWLYHAARLPNVRRIFHVGGEVDFDNGYVPLAPWKMLRSGKITVFPARRRFRGFGWEQIEQYPASRMGDAFSSADSLEGWLASHRTELADFPLYVSLDKDVMTAEESVVNWDSGHLKRRDVQTILEAFLHAADYDLAGMDVVGDWSPVNVRGILRRLLHWVEHPTMRTHPDDACRRNGAINAQLLEFLGLLPTHLSPLVSSAVGIMRS